MLRITRIILSSE